jgi:hypothetical protein
MTFCRISQATLALQQCRSVLKAIRGLKQDDATNNERLYKELSALTELLAATLVNRRDYSKKLNDGLFDIDPRFLLFEFCHGMMLRPSQVVLVRKLIKDIRAGRSVCHQMIMGAGKTTVVGPLLAMLLATEQSLIFEVVPPALLEFSAGVLRERFSLFVPKTVFTFSFDRYNSVSEHLLAKLEIARYNRAVIVSTPSSIKSFMLKFLELCHNLERQKNLMLEKKEKEAINSFFSLSKVRGLLGISSSTTFSSGELTLDDIHNARIQLQLCEKIFNILQESIEIMDEVDIILHPLKSELNWPLGLKDPLDFTRSRHGNGLRWAIPSHLLDAIFGVCKMPILADIADSRVAVTILEELKAEVKIGFDKYYLQQSPHFVLLSKEFYDQQLRPLLARWLLLWLRARKVPILSDEEIIQFLLRGNKAQHALLEKMKYQLQDEHMKMLNLSHDWLSSYLPFVLQKINRVHFGLLQQHDLKLLEDNGVKIPTSRKLVAVPFVAKDVPSRASEFAHPDVLIGLTILAYRYEGLRNNDFQLLLRHMKDCLEDEGGPYKDRPTFQRFEHWILTCGKAIRGSKKKPRSNQKYAMQLSSSTPTDLEAQTNKLRLEQRYKHSVFGKIFDLDEDLIWPIQLVDAHDKEQFKVLYPLLFRLPHAVMFYLNDLIFPEVLAYQGLKLSACGQELGGDLIFKKKIGFSGTPSDILPIELGSCQYERGSDGRVVHYLTSTDIVTINSIPTNWNVRSILDIIAHADPPYHALIDTGALITGMSNKAVADYLLRVGLSTMKGVVYLDEEDRQMVLLRKGFKVMKLADCGLSFNERFTFYDHVSFGLVCFWSFVIKIMGLFALFCSPCSVGTHDWYGHQTSC